MEVRIGFTVPATMSWTKVMKTAWQIAKEVNEDAVFNGLRFIGFTLDEELDEVQYEFETRTEDADEPFDNVVPLPLKEYRR